MLSKKEWIVGVLCLGTCLSLGAIELTSTFTPVVAAADAKANASEPDPLSPMPLPQELPAEVSIAALDSPSKAAPDAGEAMHAEEATKAARPRDSQPARPRNPKPGLGGSPSPRANQPANGNRTPSPQGKPRGQRSKGPQATSTPNPPKAQGTGAWAKQRLAVQAREAAAKRQAEAEAQEAAAIAARQAEILESRRQAVFGLVAKRRHAEREHALALRELVESRKPLITEDAAYRTVSKRKSAIVRVAPWAKTTNRDGAKVQQFGGRGGRGAGAGRGRRR